MSGSERIIVVVVVVRTVVVVVVVVVGKCGGRLDSADVVEPLFPRER